MNGLFSLIPLIIFFPFLGVIINVFFGRRLMPTRHSIGPGVLASMMAGLSFLIAVLMWVALLGRSEGAEVPFLPWINIPVGDRVLDISWTFKVDTLSSVMMLVVTGVGTLIHIYAIGYMHGDIDEQANKRGLNEEDATDLKRRRFSRFFTYLNLFLGSMLILVTGDNYLMMFVGWELVGLCSYLLIGFWFDDPISGISNASAGKKAFVVNRVGDFGMVLAIMLTFWTFGSLKFNEVFARAECMKAGTQAECLAASGESAHVEETEEHAEGEGAELTFETPIQFGAVAFPLSAVVTAITLFLLLGATGKSAQIPLFVWLPDAMAGPTPVSALIHAATMVTAGIYMITRSNVLYAMAPLSGETVAIVGALTAFVAATIAVGQFDIKRVLAYSTISQLGFMIAAVGLGGYVAGIFHLATHAFFKALLFLSAGSVIHGMEHGHHAVAHHGHGHDDHHDEHPFDPQDMRNMGGLASRMPITTWVYVIGSLALAGIVPLSGFWSKDEILLDAWKENQLVFALLLVAAFFTAFYMGRQVLMVFFGQPRTDPAAHAAESPAVMTTPLIVLAVLSVIGGAMNLPFGNLHFLAEWLHESVVNAHVPAAGEGFDLFVAGLSTILALIAISVSWLVYGQKPLAAGQSDPLSASGPLFTFLNRKWLWDETYALLIIRPYNALARFLADVVDWQFWHNYVHDTIITNGFYNGWSRILSQPIDKGLVDGAFNGLASLINGSSKQLRRTQTGYVRNYALAVAFGVVLVLAFLVYQFLK